MGNEHTVLIVGGEEHSDLRALLADKFNVEEAADGNEALMLLDERGAEISVIMLDLTDNETAGYAFLKVFRTRSESAAIPVMVLSENSENEAPALRLGAYDFILKPYNAEIVMLRLENVLLKSRCISLREMKNIYEHDPLTGLYNKNKFIDATRTMIFNNGNRRFAMVRFDINRFHLVNAYFGIANGDRILIEVARKLESMLTERFDICTYGRVNRDVFIYCIPTADKGEIEATVKTMSDFLREENSKFKMQICCGIYIVEDGEINVNRIYDKANVASKGCKDSYTNYFEYYTQTMDDKAREEQEIVNDMEKAVENGEFEVWYQPKYDIINNAPVGAEALVRWKHPGRGLVPPNKFIPVFENNGFITSLDRYVWEKTCRDLSVWIAEGKAFPVSVNVSRVDLMEMDVVKTLNELTEKYNIPHSMLNVEVTESAYTEKPELLIQIVNDLKAEGYLIYMDDFGSGYSSLSLLKDIDVNVLKIDMRFFENGSLEKKSKNILASIIRMAKLLDMSVVAEGVETEEQVRFLKAWDCEYVQGYYFAKPMPKKEYEEYIEKAAV